MESWVNFSGKEGHTAIQGRGLKLRPAVWEAEILPLRQPLRSNHKVTKTVWSFKLKLEVSFGELVLRSVLRDRSVDSRGMWKRNWSYPYDSMNSCNSWLMSTHHCYLRIRFRPQLRVAKPKQIPQFEVSESFQNKEWNITLSQWEMFRLVEYTTSTAVTMGPRSPLLAHLKCNLLTHWCPFHNKVNDYEILYPSMSNFWFHFRQTTWHRPTSRSLAPSKTKRQQQDFSWWPPLYGYITVTRWKQGNRIECSIGNSRAKSSSYIPQLWLRNAQLQTLGEWLADSYKSGRFI